MPFIGTQPAETALTTGNLGDDIVTLAKLASGTDGELITWDASGNPATVAAGTAGHFLKSQGAGSVPVFADAGGGKIVQVVNTQTGAVATTTTQAPQDDTIPQNNEGGEFMTLAITPTSASNKLFIQVAAHGAPDGDGDHGWGALFQDSTANALAAIEVNQPNGGARDRIFVINHYMAAGTTSETTFKFRAGQTSSGTFTFNGANGGTRGMGGVMASSITIWEIEV